MKMHTGVLATALAVALTATGCGGTDAAPNPPPSDRSAPRAAAAAAAAPDVDASVVRGTLEYDYDPAPSVSALVKERPAAVVGEVVGWADGRTVVESDGSGYVDTSYTAVLEVKVSQRYQTVRGQEVNGRTYVEISRGGEIEIDGRVIEGTEPGYTTIEQLSDAVPAGTRVIFAGEEVPTAEEWESLSSDGDVRSAGAGYPEGATLLWPSPQGLIFEDSTGAFDSGMAGPVNEWGWLPAGVPMRNGFDHLLEELEPLGE